MLGSPSRAAPSRALVVCLGVLALAGAACGKKSADNKGPAQDTSAPSGETLFGNLGSHHRAITTSVPGAQRYFDQGLILVFSFNHDEAIRSFQAAAALDSSAAMPYWGIALANGPHINNPMMDEAHSLAAWQALTAAQARLAGASDVERGLIEALSHRYADPIPQDRIPLDQAYAEAMRGLWKQYPQDPDVGALTAEALMDVHPWDFWTQDGLAQPWTGEITSTLETVLKMAPEHPLANHLYIHAVEASPEPERALPSADRLRTLVPGAGHMVHMPAHIYVRVGRWGDAATQNELAIQVDREYRAKSPQQHFYRIYMAHNHHFLSWACQMQGRSEEALRAAREMIAGIPPDFLHEFAFFADGFMTIEMETLMRFGRWEDILKLNPPPDFLPISTAMWHSTRGIAYAALGQVDSAKVAEAAFDSACTHVTEEMIVGNNPARTVLSIAKHLLRGEILARETGKIDEAVAELQTAVTIEDGLRYDEAPDWLHPVRHALGAVLMRAGRYSQAEQVSRDDLTRNRENGWALQGLAQCLRQRKAPEAEEVEARFRQAWARADVKIQTSCFCQSY
jgi:tetratricopeptide (TPR) repeat protein